jgi:hypothetical protein
MHTRFTMITAATSLMLLAATPAKAGVLSPDYPLKGDETVCIPPNWFPHANCTVRPDGSQSIIIDPLAAPAANAGACLTVDENHKITLHGRIVQSATTEEEEGDPPHKYMAIVLDKPICNLDNRNQTLLPADSISKKLLGHYVDVTGSVMVTADVDWSFHVQSIKDVH